MNNTTSAAFFCGFLVMGGIGMIAKSRNDLHWERQAIEHGAAHYDEKTAQFTWNEEKE